MNTLRKIYCRAFQKAFHIAIPFLPYRKPKIAGSVKELPEIIMRHKCTHVLIITDGGIMKLGLTRRLEKALKEAGIPYTIYDKTVANPTTVNVREALELYHKEGCDAIIGFGGGSSMDCAKAVGACAVKPNQSLAQMKGILMVHKKLPLLMAVPTTAGTGSETTLAAVITDADTRYKYAINDFSLIPHYAVLEPEVTVGLPAQLTATTGMDALTHAIEGYTTKAAWEMTDMFHLKAIELISKSLRSAVANEKEGREGMALGEYIAGMGFSNVGLGIAHSMAHTLGAVYDTPHGVACAMMLPIVMEYNADCTGEKYRDIARAMGVKGVDEMSVDEYRKAAIDAVQQLSVDVGIPTKLEALKEEDLQFLAESAHADACAPGNPKDASVEDLKALFRKLM